MSQGCDHSHNISYTVPEEQAERGGASGEAVTCAAPPACVCVSVRSGERKKRQRPPNYTVQSVQTWISVSEQTAVNPNLNEFLKKFLNRKRH